MKKWKASLLATAVAGTTILAIIGIFIERWLFIKESQENIYDGNA